MGATTPDTKTPGSPSPAPPPPLRPELLDEVLELLEASPSPDRRTSRWFRAGLAMACIVLAGMVFFAYGGLRGGGHRPVALILATTLGSALIAGLALWLSAGQRSMFTRPMGVLLAALVGTPIALFTWKIGWSASVPGALDAWPGRIGVPCLQISMLSGIGPLLALIWLGRHDEPNYPGLLGAVFGVVAGACAWVVTDLWCPVGHVDHLLLGHVLPLALFALAGAALGARWLRMRWSTNAGRR